MIKWIIRCSIAFTVGNMIWPYIGQYGDPKFFYIPLSVLLLLLFIEVKKEYETTSKIVKVYLEFFVWLAWGNVIKQIFYTEDPSVYIKGYKMPVIKLLNDFVWGAFFVGRLIYKLWVIRKQISGKN
jgi:hypothetical protein